MTMKQMTVLGRTDTGGTGKGVSKYMCAIFQIERLNCNLFIQIRIEIIAYNLSM